MNMIRKLTIYILKHIWFDIHVSIIHSKLANKPTSKKTIWLKPWCMLRDSNLLIHQYTYDFKILKYKFNDIMTIVGGGGGDISIVLFIYVY
jgi:hypothetical protein